MNLLIPIKNTIKYIQQARGWSSNRRIVVFESDDWGSIRMPSYEVYAKYIKNGYKNDDNVFDKYDSLASEEDLTFLFDLLQSYKDRKGNHPIFTANCLVSNPDFKRIAENDYDNYYYELITETFNNYPLHKNNFYLWKRGLKEKVFLPQSHGREHLNVSRFMKDLKERNEDLLFAFNNKMPGISNKKRIRVGNEYVVALEHYDEDDKARKNKIIRDGLLIFEKLFGYKSTCFTANNYVWNTELEGEIAKDGINILQGCNTQLIPKGKYKGFNRKYNYLGKVNRHAQVYLTRNVFFEPTLKINHDWVGSCLKSIDHLFKNNKPVIISTHRVNYVGYIFKENRDNTLFVLKKLLNKMIQKWPDIEFMTSVELGNIILKNKNKK